MNFQRGREREPLEINLVPMIDVMLVILIFLMISTTYSKYTELQINLPSAQAERQADRPVAVPAAFHHRCPRLPLPSRC
jgi:biopolymer transport protein ExbD